MGGLQTIAGLTEETGRRQVLRERVDFPAEADRRTLASPPYDRTRFDRQIEQVLAIWHERYRSIVDLEKHLHRNGTRIIKFFLNLSKEEQRKRFLERIDDPDKNWKFGMADVEERKYWDVYMTAYEACLGATSTKEMPWHVVPADDKKNARLIISEIILDVFNGLNMSYPKTTASRREELQAIRAKLAK